MDDLEVFVAVVDAEGFSAAAERLGLSVTAISRRVQALEKRLGTRLLNRSTRRISLTEAGELYHREVRRLLGDLGQIEVHLSQLANEPRGQLRIAAPMSFGTLRLAREVARFARTYPEIQVQMQLDDRCVDIIEEGFDLALRIGNPRSSRLVARHLLSIERWVCASPAYLAERGTPRTPLDLLAHDCLRYNNLSAREEWTFSGPVGTQAIEVQGRFCSNNGEVLREAAEQGLGIGALPDFLVTDALAAGRLVRLLEGYQPPAFALFALYPTRQLMPTKVRLLLDFLVACLPSGR